MPSFLVPLAPTFAFEADHCPHGQDKKATPPTTCTPHPNASPHNTFFPRKSGDCIWGGLAFGRKNEKTMHRAGVGMPVGERACKLTNLHEVFGAFTPGVAHKFALVL